MIKIQFDHQAFSMQRYGGISRYFANIQKHLANSSEFSYNRGLLFTNNAYIKDQKFPLPEWLWRAFITKDRKIFKYNRKYSKYCVRNHDYDIFHPTYYNPYFLSSIKKPFVLTVHDFIHELFPEYFLPNDDTAHYKSLLIKKAAHIIAISQSTKNDLQRIYNIPDDKVSLVYHGYEPVAANNEPKAHIPGTEYILFVGDRPAYKNFFKWVTAVTPLLTKYNINVICAGGGEFTKTELDFIHRLNIKNKIRQVWATEAMLASLYQNALLFAYPSLYEGFGFPILEAFANSCPVAVSNTSCFKEVGGDAAVYFDPYSIESMQMSIDGILSKAVDTDKMRGAGSAQLSNFTMESCMQKTTKVYRSLV
ncbi:glycosyltransferase family 1 protein [Mucilaginibacter sp. AK015]|uniref:glycosyltransferase family 4 protein n=1 Tax=Mucilaginibacter sp. AK015 TaxID=2723072 RepID=UPI001608151F|nr:glycosyltransferase family 1 protein [Mucilaginibacter sp. AK015]MBB5397099.1 glycosyltransferase involved in cell wall biosynthesis [Mucilaginibacter sp. AK015]